MTAKPLALALLFVFASASAQNAGQVSGITPMIPQPATATPEGYTLNLKGADIGVLIQTVSEVTGKSFIVDPRVEAKVTVVSAKPLAPDARPQSDSRSTKVASSSRCRRRISSQTTNATTGIATAALLSALNGQPTAWPALAA